MIMKIKFGRKKHKSDGTSFDNSSLRNSDDVVLDRIRFYSNLQQMRNILRKRNGRFEKMADN